MLANKEETMFNENNVPELTMGQKLKMFREINKLSQDELGQKLNVSDKTISAWENEEREINLSNSKLICELFDIPNSYFVFNENYQKLSDEKKSLINEYIKTSQFRNNIETIISICKQKIENDGLPFKKEYLPTFDYEKKEFSSCGIFSIESLPIKITKTSTIRIGEYFNNVTFNNNIHSIESYKYDSSALAKFGLYDILERFNSNTVEIKDLTNCNSLEIFKNTLLKMRNKTYTRRNPMNPFAELVDVSNETIQEQLNDVLENLNPNLSKYWHIIVFLIDNGAYYTKQYGWGSDVVCWNDQKDVSKTNLIYRIAKDKLEK